jgi:hypothetical protein
MTKDENSEIAHDPKSDSGSEGEKNTERSSGDKPWWSEMMKDLTLTGLATVFMTEDSVRGYLKDKKLPKEIVSLVLEGFSKKKDDFYGLLAKEFGRVLSKIDLSAEIAKFMEEHKVHVEISFDKKINDKNSE